MPAWSGFLSLTRHSLRVQDAWALPLSPDWLLYFVTNITTKLPWHIKHEKAERRAANGASVPK